MRNKILLFILMIFMTCQMAFSATPFSANAKTKRIPAGTILSLKMITPMNTAVNQKGSEFSALLLTDQKSTDEDVILPMGSVIRGNIKDIKPSKRMSKGPILYLDFDHVVTPNGRQLPLSLLVTGRADLTADGGITTTKGYLDAWKQTCKKSGHITKDAIQWGKDVTDSGWQYVVVPVAAFGGVFGTAGYFVFDSVADAIRKGKEVRVNSNEVLNVILLEPIDVPVI